MSSKIKNGRTSMWTVCLTIGIILLVMTGLSIYEQREKNSILSEMTVSEETLLIPVLEEGLSDVYPWEEDAEGMNTETVPVSDPEIDDAVPAMLLRLCTLFDVTGDLSLNNLKQSDGYYYHAAEDENDISYAMTEKCVWAFAEGSAAKRWDMDTLMAAEEELSGMLLRMELKYDEADMDNPIYRFCEWYDDLRRIYLDKMISMDENSELLSQTQDDAAPVENVRQALIDTRSGYVYIRNGRLFLAYDLGETYLGVQFDPETFDIIGYQVVAHND